jgi:Polyketide cyclase / dehydrase and lipid transport
VATVSRRCLCLLFAAYAGVTQAFQVEHAEARYADRQYQCELVATLDAPPERVEQVLRGYEEYPQLDPRILASRVVERPQANVALLETMLRACFGPFCRNVKRLERVEELPYGLSATVDAAHSDVRFGEMRTELAPTKSGGTRVTYRMRVVPGFWIPPLVGRRWMLRAIEESTRRLFMNVETKAQTGGADPGPPEADPPPQ